jgi:hypothetical protein
MRYRLLAELSRRPIRANGCLLLDFLGPAIACQLRERRYVSYPAAE